MDPGLHHSVYGAAAAPGALNKPPALNSCGSTSSSKSHTISLEDNLESDKGGNSRKYISSLGKMTQNYKNYAHHPSKTGLCLA